MDPLEAQKHLGHGHHDHYHWYDYALLLPWLWKSFVHAKHEAFAFKYDPLIDSLGWSFLVLELSAQKIRPASEVSSLHAPAKPNVGHFPKL